MPEKTREELERVAQALNESPFYRHLGMRIVRIEDGRSEMQMELGPKHRNIWNTFHGGAVASILDSTCGSSLYSSLAENEGAITIDLRINYLSPPAAGLLTGKGRFVHRTKALAWSEAEAFDSEGKRVAISQAIHRIIKREWGK